MIFHAYPEKRHVSVKLQVSQESLIFKRMELVVNIKSASTTCPSASLHIFVLVLQGGNFINVIMYNFFAYFQTVIINFLKLQN